MDKDEIMSDKAVDIVAENKRLREALKTARRLIQEYGEWELNQVENVIYDALDDWPKINP